MPKLEGTPWKDDVLPPVQFETVQNLAKNGLKVYLCDITFERLKIDRELARKAPFISFVPSGVATVAALAELHALSERLDTAMGIALPDPDIDAATYAMAWRRSSDAAERERQIALTVALGLSLDRLTRKPLLRKSLRMMRAPAMAAGLGELQSMLERGFDAFGVMRGAQEFLAIVGARERSLASRLFAASAEVLRDLP